jgi:hypothetical protein
MSPHSALWRSGTAPSGGYELLSCARFRDGLYVLMAGPMPEGYESSDFVERAQPYMRVTTASGAELQSVGLAAMASKRRGRVYLVEFSAPDPGERLRVMFYYGDAVVYVAEAVPVDWP